MIWFSVYHVSVVRHQRVSSEERLISDAENTTEDTKENKEPEKADVVGENNKEESLENNVKEETTNKMKETESKVE